MAQDRVATCSHLTRTEAERKLAGILASFANAKKGLMQRIYRAQRSVTQLCEADKELQQRLVHVLKERRKLTSELWDVNRKTVTALTSLPAVGQHPGILWGSKDCRATNHSYEDIFLLLRQLHRSWSKPELTYSQVTRGDFHATLHTVMFSL